MRVLYVAEIVGKAGIYAIRKGLPELCRRVRPDFVLGCADGATGGGGLGRSHAAYLRKLGVSVLTTGDCCFYKKDLTENLARTPYVIRPANLNAAAPGVGARVCGVRPGGPRVGVAVLLGQAGFTRLHGDNPCAALPALVERLRRETPFVIVDFHAQATAEKQTLFVMADGLCSAVIGSHCRVQTADERVLPRGTAVITDAGRTGALDSVGGADPAFRVAEYLTGIPDWTRDGWRRPEIQGVIIEIDARGAALSIERVRHPVPEMPAPPGGGAGAGGGDDSEGAGEGNGDA